ncbi:MAG TPA: ATP-binding protein [Desulfobacterales bacterium]|nr:ATP-binding protein [Desulfobacterales bacterium]
MFSLRAKILLGFGGLLIIVAAIGLLTVAQIRDLGQAIDIILKENYRSVVACQEMKESIERVDRGIVFTFLEADADGRRQIEAGLKRFSEALTVEMGNITLPGEGEKSHHLEEIFHAYSEIVPKVTDPSRPLEESRADYFSIVLPQFEQIKKLAQEILEMNQANMSEANDAARSQAASAQRRMTIAILSCAGVAILFSLLAQRWILDPIRRLIESANEIRRGNLELVVNADSRDEIGRLSEAFNAMAEGLRNIRRSDRRNLMRTRQVVSEVFKALPAAIAVLDLEDRVEVATEPAGTFFGLKPAVRLKDLGYEWLTAMVRRALDEGRVVENTAADACIQIFRDNREYFFSPVVVPILMESGRGEISGTAIILKDVTSLREQQEIKRSAVTTVSHQLRNPLTSIRMSVHLLLEETLGPLNARQTELLLAAREESERLTTIVEELLDLNRMESGKTLLDIEPVSPHAMVRDGVEPFLSEAKDKGITLTMTVPDDLPNILGDSKRLQHVLTNLLSNALRFTNPGGSVSVDAEAEPAMVRFAVTDSGRGIASEHLARLFDPFYRVPGQDRPTGVGLGLAIVKEIVKTHGGSVGVTSEPGKGSTFWFTLPQDAGAATPAADVA